MNAGSELEKEAFAPESIAMLKGGSLCDAICGFFHDKGGEEFLCKVGQIGHCTQYGTALRVIGNGSSCTSESSHEA